MVLSSETFVDKLLYYNVQFFNLTLFNYPLRSKCFILRYKIWNNMLTIRTMDDVCMLILIILTRGTFSLETVTIVDLSLRVVSIIINTLICITIVVQTRYTCYIRSIHFSCYFLWADEHYGMVFKSLKCRKRLGYISTDCPMSNL